MTHLIEVGDNSFVSIAEADEIVAELYFEDDEEARVWMSLNDSNKERLLKYASAKIDKALFIGRKYVESGTKLSFPRMIEGDIVDTPLDVKQAVMVYGLKRMVAKDTQDEYSKLKDNGVKSYQIEGASVTFGENSGREKVRGIPRDIIDDFLIDWIY